MSFLVSYFFATCYISKHRLDLVSTRAYIVITSIAFFDLFFKRIAFSLALNCNWGVLSRPWDCLEPLTHPFLFSNTDFGSIFNHYFVLRCIFLGSRFFILFWIKVSARQNMVRGVSKLVFYIIASWPRNRRIVFA